jgi:membrane protease YdiL (CAAX protease family)
MAGFVASSAAPTARDRARAFVLLLASPIIEEVVLRAGLHEELLRKRMRPWIANACAAAMFCAGHAVVRGAEAQVLLLAAPALVIGAAYNLWRSLPTRIAIHAALNALWIGGVHRMVA